MCQLLLHTGPSLLSVVTEGNSALGDAPATLRSPTGAQLSALHLTPPHAVHAAWLVSKFYGESRKKLKKPGSVLPTQFVQFSKLEPETVPNAGDTNESESPPMTVSTGLGARRVGKHRATARRRAAE